jgi:hypothetical protein
MDNTSFTRFVAEVEATLSPDERAVLDAYRDHYFLLMGDADELRVIDGKLYSVTKLDPTPQERTQYDDTATNPIAFEADCGDAGMLALVIERHHDYPDADMLGHIND